jgi:hypothetical protein
VRILDELGLCWYVLNSVAVPMVPSAGNKMLWMQVRGVSGRSVIRVIAPVMSLRIWYNVLVKNTLTGQAKRLGLDQRSVTVDVV